MSSQQYKRKATLVVGRPERTGNNPSAYVPASTLDLSDFHFTFSTQQQDVESPSNCSIRIYNLSRDTLDNLIKNEYSSVVLQAGYESLYGVIFKGTVKQYRVGKENATTSYLDLLAADGDQAYNYSVVAKTLAASSTPQDRVKAALEAMGQNGVTAGYLMPFSGGVLPRGKVLFGMARAAVRNEARQQGATWNITDGKVNVVPLEGYLPGEAVELNALTGMVGIPEQTENGIRVRTLLNPKIVVGGLVKIDNRSINRIVQQNPQAAPVAYNSYTGIQLLATVTNDGLYRVFVAEHQGDTRGQAWYTDIVCLAVDPSSKKVQVR